MRVMLRFLCCLVIFGSIALAAVPVQSALPGAMKAGCCATMKVDGPEKGCNHHGSQSDQDQQCCSGCVSCLAMLFATTTPFVYSPTGEENYSTLSIREHARPDRPPVPPPRT